MRTDLQLNSIIKLVKKKFFIEFSFYLFVYFWLCWVFVAARGLFSNCGKRGLLFVVVFELLIAMASLCCEIRALGVRALGAWASVVVACGFSSCGIWA